MNYTRRQEKAKLSNWYIARKLGLKLNEYKEVRNGRRALANEKLDIFMEITDPNNQEWINQENEFMQIEEWYKTFSLSLLKEFNLTQQELSKEIGVDQAALSRHFSGKDFNQNIEAFCYYFFTDDNNRKYKKDKKKKQHKVQDKKDVEEEVQLPQNSENGAIEIDNEAIKKEEIWYNEFQKMSNLYFSTKEELDRYKFLIDELRVKRATIEELMQVSFERNK